MACNAGYSVQRSAKKLNVINILLHNTLLGLFAYNLILRYRFSLVV